MLGMQWSRCLLLHVSVVQLYCAVGRHNQALDVASQLCSNAPEDANAHALHLLLLAFGGISSENAPEALVACRNLLRCDPSAQRCCYYCMFVAWNLQ
jgi:hypothetical protein